ncbi:MAG: MBL fold metallo-hydrolase, partial [Methanosarcina vacuolata]|nr:MBL fold metallo-hydrolase [Methanosarcina vacuolata]
MASIATAAENLTVHFIDVGQGDSILLQYGDKDMLIDAGERSESDTVAELIKNEGITSLDYVVATHPHADHIGGISDILKAFPVGQFLDSGYPYTSGTYEYMLETINSTNIPFKTVKRGDKIDFASGIEVEVLNPGSSYFTDDLNQNSVVLKVTDGAVTFLFMGDAGIEAENAIIKDGYNVNADIFKVGHHGSSTSSGEAFISAVSPSVCVIEVGAGNEYGHPHTETLEKLQKASKVYRTDIDGTVTVTTDGSTYSVTTENADNTSDSSPQDVVSPAQDVVFPVADFSANVTSGNAPLSVQFTDKSQNAVSRNWDVDNDGNIDNTSESFVHVYQDQGKYTVNLTVSNENGTDYKTQDIIVSTFTILPIADFSVNITSGNAPLAVMLTDKSQDATSRNWDIGNDGTIESTKASFVYV